MYSYIQIEFMMLGKYTDIVFYNVMLLLSLYNPKLKKTIKYTYWTVHGLIVLCLLFIFLMMGVAAKADVELDRPFIGTKKMIIK